MKPEDSDPEAAAERRELLAQLFHALSQPLTTLRCSLELAMLRPHTEEQYRETAKAALAQAERISSLFSAIRELLEPEAETIVPLRPTPVRDDS